MSNEVIQNKVCETANMLREEESYYRKAWNNLFVKYETMEDEYEYTLDEIESSLTRDPEIDMTVAKASAVSVSLSGEESFPNPNMSFPDRHTLHRTRSLTSSDEDSFHRSPLKILELNIDKLSPEQVNHVSKPSSVSITITTAQQTDVLCLDTTSPIRLSRTPFTPLYSPPKRITKLARLESNEVLPEVEQMISRFFKEFINTDALPVLRGILTFKSFRYRAETQNRLISPYIEKSLSIPLRYKQMEYTFRITPLSERIQNRGCSYNQTMFGRRAIGMTRSSNDSSFRSSSKLISDKSYENCPIKLLETSQTKVDTYTPSKVHLADISRNNLVKTPSIIRSYNPLETSNIFVSNSSYENCPIKLLETSQIREDTSIRETPAKTHLTSSNSIDIANRPLFNNSNDTCPVKLLETSQIREDTSIRETPAKTHLTSSNSINIANRPLFNNSHDTCPVKLLETQVREDTSIRDTPIRTQLTNISQTNIARTSNNFPIKLFNPFVRDVLRHNINEDTPLAPTSPNCSMRLLDTCTPDILASNSRSICQPLDLIPSVYRPLSNSTPSKRTFSKMNEANNLSKRVRLDCDTLKSANADYLD